MSSSTAIGAAADAPHVRRMQGVMLSQFAPMSLKPRFVRCACTVRSCCCLLEGA